MDNEIKINLKLSIKNFDEYQNKIEEVKSLIAEINKTELILEVEQNEIKDLSDCANQVKNSD